MGERHMEVQAAHASAHTAAIAGVAWVAAERHCQSLVEHYIAVYPAWHPISGLQMYTLGELKEKNGHTREAREWYARARDVLGLTHGKDHCLVQDLSVFIEAIDSAQS